MSYEKLPGIYESTKIESTKDGTPVDETVRPGTLLFTPEGRISVVSASDQKVMAYNGSYTIEEDALKITVESCSYREMEGKTITRRIVSFDDTELVIEAVGADQTSILSWHKTHSL